MIELKDIKRTDGFTHKIEAKIFFNGKDTNLIVKIESQIQLSDDMLLKMVEREYKKENSPFE